jgi:anti-sigma28 factor (negative regulator of flagellin synthesis)
MSGLEALGLAANIMQVIGFAMNTASCCRAIYNGDPTDETVLQEHATSLSNAASRLLDSPLKIQPHNPVEKDLLNVAKKCSEVAQQLQDELRSITNSHQQKNAYKAVKSITKSFFNKRKVEKLEKSLQNYRYSMETQILVQL